ncbi:hypothetical protein D3Z47_11570 [Lachnospiraceae bacterium]|nr:hypothetical protein [Lachnospiraceae bacterium]
MGDKAGWMDPELEERGDFADMAMALSAVSGANEKHLGEAGVKAILKLIKGITPEKIGAIKKNYTLFYGNLMASSGRDFTINPDEYFIHQSGCEPGVPGYNSCGNVVNSLIARVTGFASVGTDVDNLVSFVMDVAVGHQISGNDAICYNRNHIFQHGEKTRCYVNLWMKSDTLLHVDGDSKTYIQQIELLRRE